MSVEDTYNRLHGYMLRMAGGLVGFENAEDLVQDAALAILEYERDGMHPESETAYMLGSIRLLALHSWEVVARRKRAWRTYGPLRLYTLPDEEFQNSAVIGDQTKAVLLAVDVIEHDNPVSASMLRLLMQGRSRSEIKIELNLTETQFRVRKNRMLNKARAIIAKQARKNSIV